MEIYIDNLFFTNVFISKEIKTQNIIQSIELNKHNIYEFSTNDYISTIEIINDKIHMNVNNLIELFLIYEKQKCLNKSTDIFYVKQNIKKYVIKLLYNNYINQYLEKFLKEFFQLIYLNILSYNKILKYNIYHSLIKFFNSIKNDKYIFLTKEIKNNTCFICIDTNLINKLLCCDNLICKKCFDKLEYCPYCNISFCIKTDINILEFKNLYDFL